jgi:hypothetical protein
MLCDVKTTRMTIMRFTRNARTPTRLTFLFMTYYKTFTRSANNWKEFFKRGRKRTVETGLTYAQAIERCHTYNQNRTSRQIAKGTRLEFTAQ